MRWLFILALLALIACSGSTESDWQPNLDSLTARRDTVKAPHEIVSELPLNKPDTFNQTEQALASIAGIVKEAYWDSLKYYIHPKRGLRIKYDGPKTNQSQTLTTASPSDSLGLMLGWMSHFERATCEMPWSENETTCRGGFAGVHWSCTWLYENNRYYLLTYEVNEQ